MEWPQFWHLPEEGFLSKILIIIFLTLVCTTDIAAQTKDYYFTVNYAKARPLAMGGAYMAVEGGLATIFFNPASFRLSSDKQGIRITSFFNPFASASLYSYYKRDLKKGISNSEWRNIVKLLPRALVVSSSNWEFVILGHEELETRRDIHKNQRFFVADSLFIYSLHSTLLKIRLANQVFIGGTLSYFNSPQSLSFNEHVGFSYGIYLLPSTKLGVGVVFTDVPNDFKNVFLDYNRIEDGSVNVGISYKPNPNNNISIDVRNISEEDKLTTREWHFGVEQSFWDHIALRSGYFRSPKDKINYFSFGVGLLNLNFSKYGVKKFINPLMALNYSILFENNGGTTNRSHFLSFNLGF